MIFFLIMPLFSNLDIFAFSHTWIKSHLKLTTMFFKRICSTTELLVHIGQADSFATCGRAGSEFSSHSLLLTTSHPTHQIC